MNDNTGLEREADVMGEKAIQKPDTVTLNNKTQLKSKTFSEFNSVSSSAQLKTIQRAQNDAKTEENARTNCALVTIANLTGKDKSSEVSGNIEQHSEFFINFMLDYDERLANIEDTEDNNMDLQTMGMIAWIFKDKGAYPKGWTAAKFEASIVALAAEEEPNVNVPRTVSVAEEEMKLHASGTKFAIQFTGAGGMESHWLIAENNDGTIKYTDDQANRPAREVIVDNQSDVQQGSVRGSVDLSSGGGGSVKDDLSDVGSRKGSIQQDDLSDLGSPRRSIQSLTEPSKQEDSQKGDLPEAKPTRGNLWVKAGKMGVLDEYLAPNEAKEVAVSNTKT